MRYLGLICCFALGLMAKPMLVTLPFVLLLLDYWPLQRLEQKKPPQKIAKPLSKNKKKGKNTASLAKVPVQTAVSQWSLIRPLIIEKIPLFALTLLSSIITYLVQQEGGAMRTFETLPLATRMANAFVSYIAYMAKMLWPTNLAVLYPHPGGWPLWRVLGSAVLLIAITAWAVRGIKKRPYAAVGWFWYVGTLVPVVGIVQVGEQAMADRYTYIPLIGLFIIVAWGVPELFKNWRFRKEALIVLPAMCISCLFFLTWGQVGYWRNSVTLFDHVLKVTDRNAIAYYTRGNAYAILGNYRQAIEDYNKAIQLNPKYTMAYYNRGIAYGNLSNHRQAIEDYNKAIQLNPKFAEAYNSRGNAYSNLSNHRQAIEDYNKAIQLNPKFAEAYNSRGNAYSNLSNHRQAVEDYNKAIQLNPKYAMAYYNRGIAYGNLGNYRHVIEDYNKAIWLNPKFAEAYNNRGNSYGKFGNYRQAIEDCNKAIELNPKFAIAYYNRGSAYGNLGNHRQAIEDYNKAIELNPKSAQAYNNRGIAYGNLGNYRQAIEDIKTAARLGDESAQNFLKSQDVGW
jgi:tetratricopeptide (TPR) repeat protein